MAGSLDGITIIDLTTLFSGPIATSILGDQGADVIKVESFEGDWIRLPAVPQQRNGVNGMFAMINRNKRSIVIDLSITEGKEILLHLVRRADVLVENFRPGVMERLGLGYDIIREKNPNIIYASITGFGHKGPYINRRVYDPIIQSVSGLATMQADTATEKPRMINMAVCDMFTAATAAQTITSALVARDRNGRGQRVDISMLESALFFGWNDTMINYTFVGEDVPKFSRWDSRKTICKTADGYICIMPVKEPEWTGLFKALKLPNLLENPRFLPDDGEFGFGNQEFQDILDKAYNKFTTAELIPQLDENDVPFALINSQEDVITDPQVVAMGALQEFEHPVAGAMRQPQPLGNFSETPSKIFRSSPELGEQTREILGEFGFQEDKITDLRIRKIVR
jgi:crotonobetainyl-CoA:carnitine CoA-transferase CaiB-like acyl-CoA transferase